MNPTEETFVKTFIARERRDRWLSFLPSEKNRGKLCHRLAHVLEDDLDPRFVYDKESPPKDVSSQVQQVLAQWRRANPEQLCHVIVNDGTVGRIMNLAEAESDYDLTCGAIIIVIPDKLAYYHPERSNISRQPFILLFHPYCKGEAVDKTVVPIHRLTRRSSGNISLWFAYTLVAALRSVFRVQEFFAVGKKRERLAEFREKMDIIARERDATLKKIEQGYGSSTVEMMEASTKRHGDSQTRSEMDAFYTEIRAIHDEGKTLQGIVRATGDDKALAIEGLREFLYAHPESVLAYSYLGGCLSQTGDLEGSLAAYRQSELLAGADPIHGPSARRHIGEVLLAKGETDAAIGEFRRLIEDASPKNEYMICYDYLYLGNSLEQKGDSANARVAWKQAVKWGKTNTVAKLAQEKLVLHT